MKIAFSQTSAVERAYYSGWIPPIKCSHNILFFSSAGSSTICYGTQWTKQRRTLKRIRSSGKISSRFQTKVKDFLSNYFAMRLSIPIIFSSRPGISQDCQFSF